MGFKKYKKFFERRLGRYGLLFSFLIFRILPGKSIYGFADFVAKLGFVIAGKKRKHALESLNIAFGKEKDSKELKQIALASFEYMARGILELLYLIEHPHLISRKVSIEGKGNLDKAIAEGKGVICVTAHFGNFPLMLFKFACDGYKTNCIMRIMRDQQVEDIFNKKRTDAGIGTIYSQPRPECINKSLKALRNNELLFIQLDQNFGTGGVFVDFFGTKAATATGPVIFAMRTGAPILPMFMVRNRDNTHKMIIEPVLHLEEKATREETIVVNVSRITKIIEAYIRKYPEEWGWIHRRWKSRPTKETMAGRPVS
ncbi:MAG: lysophospholipid acyltransferase family protein [Candidatus Omnitrophica bacterium]|nr:lysophospholipid acyltransferase family protein [Candidatus Omnitrophota bacterium]